jgi:hypothetical protein
MRPFSLDDCALAAMTSDDSKASVAGGLRIR